jgi:hypothetical protein
LFRWDVHIHARVDRSFRWVHSRRGFLLYFLNVTLHFTLIQNHNQWLSTFASLKNNILIIIEECVLYYLATPFWITTRETTLITFLVTLSKVMLRWEEEKVPYGYFSRKRKATFVCYYETDTNDGWTTPDRSDHLRL